jgi:hypothetical protein
VLPVMHASRGEDSDISLLWRKIGFDDLNPQRVIRGPFLLCRQFKLPHQPLELFSQPGQGQGVVIHLSTLLGHLG